MPYSEKEYQVSNINYLNKDFSSLKSSLIEYAKTYFPNSYRDFNETSPGMMLIEMSAYVGDVLSFYIDNQYKEMLLPLAEERRNVINLANMLGYKVKPISPSYVDLDISQTVDADNTNVDNIVPEAVDFQVFDKGLKVSSTTDSTIIFETLDIVDFTMSSSGDAVPVVSDTDENGLATEFTLTRKVKAVSGETKTKTFSIGSPEKFKRITFPETNIIEILSVKDSNNNKWYEVEYLAQDKVPAEEHYIGDRTNAYYDITNVNVETIPVPYTLEFIKVPKRFITEINEDNTTSLVFGNGLLHQAASGSLSDGFFQTEQVGIIIPGETETITSDISPILGTAMSSLGESPSNTTLTVEYRIGGGIGTNIPAGDLTTLSSISRLANGNSVTPTITNLEPARGGADAQSVEEIKRKTQAHFITQKRCVTKEDYEARVLAMPAKFGNIAKVSVNRASAEQLFATIADVTEGVETQNLYQCDSSAGANSVGDTAWFGSLSLCQAGCYNDDGPGSCTITDQAFVDFAEFQQLYGGGMDVNQPTTAAIEIHLLSYDNNKNLVVPPDLLQNNLRNYLSEFRMISDEFAIYSGKVVNFGVAFDVTAHKYANKQDVKLRCINTIINYFNIDKMRFRQPIYTSELIYQLMGIEGVRGVNHVELTQGTPQWTGASITFPPLYRYTIGADGTVSQPYGDNGYGYQYDFHKFYDGTYSSDGTILPSVEPTVFELKNPNENVKGVIS